MEVSHLQPDLKEGYGCLTGCDRGQMMVQTQSELTALQLQTGVSLGGTGRSHRFECECFIKWSCLMVAYIKFFSFILSKEQNVN